MATKIKSKTKKKSTKTSKKNAPVVEFTPAEATPAPAPTQDEINQVIAEDSEATQDFAAEDITTAKFKKLFKDELKETADWLWREDKEKDFPDKATCKEAALKFVIENHPEYNVTD